MSQAPDTRPDAQLYLIAPPVGDGATTLALLLPLVKAVPVAAVRLSFGSSDTRTVIAALKEICPPLQAEGVAVLVDGHLDAVARGGADGVHLSMAGKDARERLSDALGSLKPERIVGVGDLHGPDEAMTVAEDGCDYVTFGEPFISRKAEKHGTLPPLEAVIARVAWWAELFEVPVVAFAPDLAAVPRLAATGAEFIAVGEALWQAPEGALAAARRVAPQLKRAP